MKKGITIIISSNEPWGDIWFSKQHYAYELSRLGYRVFFLNPIKKWSLKNILYSNIKSNTISENLTIVDYQNYFPIKYFPIFFTRLNDILNEYRLLNVIKPKQLIWWKFDPFRFLLTNKGKSIYHVVDPYIHFWQDKYISNNSTLIVCTNRNFIDYYESKGHKALYIPHGVSLDEFNTDMDKVQSIRKKYGNFAIIVGTINNDTDFSIIKDIADNNVKIVIIGNGENDSDLWLNLLKHKNIVYKGTVNAKELNNYISASKVGLNVYKFNLKKSIGNRTPLKIINYLSQYKPIVTTMFCDEQLADVGIYKADNNKEFINKTKQAINDELYVDKVKIKQYLDKHLYSVLITKILEKL